MDVKQFALDVRRISQENTDDLEAIPKIEKQYFEFMKDFLNQVHVMRKHQKLYFKFQSKNNLAIALIAEKKIDTMLAKLSKEKNEPKLFSNEEK